MQTRPLPFDTNALPLLPFYVYKADSPTHPFPQLMYASTLSDLHAAQFEMGRFAIIQP